MWCPNSFCFFFPPSSHSSTQQWLIKFMWFPSVNHNTTQVLAMIFVHLHNIIFRTMSPNISTCTWTRYSFNASSKMCSIYDDESSKVCGFPSINMQCWREPTSNQMVKVTSTRTKRFQLCFIYTIYFVLFYLFSYLSFNSKQFIYLQLHPQICNGYNCISQPWILMSRLFCCCGWSQLSQRR